MKASTITSVLAALATSVIARNCTPGLDYCGYTLTAIGNYRDQINQAIHDSGHGGSNPNNVLFHCEGGNSGVIRFIADCSAGCYQNGVGVSDVCNI
ncbi:hypothetical protein GQ44DRAFT_766911 [Phaeosphaeriaceae sp. PMI808]|nr:hypothetical protein GQ44DRAFT_766911 [Phaeosphaeriaceae sp. PMI808]